MFILLLSNRMFSLRDQLLDGSKVFVTRVLSSITTFLIVRFSVVELGEEAYGTWIALFSVVSWFSIFDMGIPSALRTEIANRKDSEEEIKQKLLKHALSKVGLQSSFIAIIICIGFYLVEYSPPNLTFGQFRVVAIFIAFAAVTTLLNRTTVAYYLGQSLHWFDSFNSLVSNILFLLILFLFTLNLNGFAIVSAFIPLLLMITYGIFIFRRQALSNKNIQTIKVKLNKSGEFLVIQIAALILYSTDYYLIYYLFDGEDVWTYYSISKYYSLLSITGGALVFPLWTKVAKNPLEDLDFAKIIRPQLIIVFALIALGACMFWFQSVFMELWLGSSYKPNTELSLIVLFNSLIGVFIAPFVMLINGLGKLRIQKITAIISAIINIPLSIYFSSIYGLLGVPLATLVSLSYSLVLRPLQIYKLSKGSRGIWAN